MLLGWLHWLLSPVDDDKPLKELRLISRKSFEKPLWIKTTCFELNANLGLHHVLC